MYRERTSKFFSTELDLDRIPQQFHVTV